jgi:hypothetical protein
VVEDIFMNIRTPGPSSNVKINVQGPDKGEMNSTKLLCGFQKLFAWFNEDLHGFVPGLVQHFMKTTRKKKKPIYFASKETF